MCLTILLSKYYILSLAFFKLYLISNWPGFGLAYLFVKSVFTNASLLECEYFFNVVNIATSLYKYLHKLIRLKHQKAESNFKYYKSLLLTKLFKRVGRHIRAQWGVSGSLSRYKSKYTMLVCCQYTKIEVITFRKMNVKWWRGSLKTLDFTIRISTVHQTLFQFVFQHCLRNTTFTAL